MDTIVLWESIRDIKVIKIPKNVSITYLGLSENWYILAHKKGMLIYNLRNLKELPKQIFIKYEVIEISCNLSMSLLLTVIREV